MPRSAPTSLAWPVVLLIGILALVLPAATPCGVARVLSWLRFFDGIIQFFYAFKYEGVGRILLVHTKLEENPFSSHVFVFRGTRSFN